MFVQETFCYHICQLPVGFHWLPDRLQRDGTLFPWPPRHLQGTDWEVNRSRRSFWMCTLVVTQQAPTRTCNILQPKTRSHNTWVISNKVMVQRSCALQITLTFLSVLYGLAIVNLARGLSFEESADGLHTTEIHWEIDSKQSSRGPSRTSTRMWLRLGLQDVRKESTLVWHRRRGHRRTSCTSGRSLPLTPSPEPRTVWERSSKMRRLQSSCNVIPPRSRWDNGVLAYMATDDMSCHVMTWHDSSWNLIIFWMTQTQLFGIYLCPSIFTPVPLHWMSSFVNHGQNPQELERKAKETKDLDEWHKNCGKGVWKDRSWNLWHLYGQAWTSKTFIQFFMIRTEVPRVINNLIWMHIVSFPQSAEACHEFGVLVGWIVNVQPTNNNGWNPGNSSQKLILCWFYLSLTPGDRTWNCSSSASHTWRRTRLAFCVSAASSLATLLFTVS